MPIPNLNEFGLLPEGVYDCAVVEAQRRFGHFQETDRRPRLWAKLSEFLREVSRCGLVRSVLLDGSFVTAKPVPRDIDLILVVSGDHDFSAELSATEYNVVSKRSVFRRYGFDLLVAREDSEEYRRYLAFFQQVRLEPHLRKGILRLVL
jgi:hypothetical protein